MTRLAEAMASPARAQSLPSSTILELALSPGSQTSSPFQEGRILLAPFQCALSQMFHQKSSALASADNLPVFCRDPVLSWGLVLQQNLLLTMSVLP